MYLYNVTLIAENDIGEAVYRYLTMQLTDGTHGTDNRPRLLEMLDSPHDGRTYCIQLLADNRDDITTFQQTRLASIRTHLEAVHAGKVLVFDSVMKYLNS